MSRESIDQGRRKLAGAMTLTGVAAVAGLTTTKVTAAPDFTIKLGNVTPLNHPLNVRFREAAEAISKETNGHVRVQIFPNSQLGSDSDMFSQVRSGAIQAHAVPGLIVPNAVPDCGIHGVAFAFKDYETVWRAMDGDLGAFSRNAMTSAGIQPLPKAFDNGFRQITSRDKPIKTPEDLTGFKIRCPDALAMTSIFEALGAAPTSIGMKEVYASLQARLVDGQENSILLMETFKLYEVQKYCALTNHMWDCFWLAFNKPYWDSLPADVKTVLEKHFSAAAEAQRRDVQSAVDGTQVQMTQKGVTFNTVSQAAFRQALTKGGYYDRWKKKFSPEAWKLLEKYSGVLV